MLSSGPRRVDRAPLAPQRLLEEDVGPRLEEGKELVVRVLVADHVGKAVDAGAQEVFTSSDPQMPGVSTLIL
jgi:hypothetical protein